MAIRKYHIGCTGWALKKWTGNFFTDDAKPEDYLSQYAEVFNAVEGNTTFYQIPSAETVKRWGKATPDGFKFCFKFHRSITHEQRLHKVKDTALRFIETFEPIAERLGPFHIQLPKQFSADEFKKLEIFVELLPPAFSYVLEVRHQDFYNRGNKEHRLNLLLESYNIDRVIFDARKLHNMKAKEESVRKAQQKKPDNPIRFNSTGSRPFIRFVGANNVINNESYLKEWAIVLADWIKVGLHPYIFTHSPDKVSQPKLARRFHQLLSELIELKPMPLWPVDRQDEQLDLF